MSSYTTENDNFEAEFFHRFKFISRQIICENMQLRFVKPKSSSVKLNTMMLTNNFKDHSLVTIDSLCFMISDMKLKQLKQSAFELRLPFFRNMRAPFWRENLNTGPSLRRKARHCDHSREITFDGLRHQFKHIGPSTATLRKPIN